MIFDVKVISSSSTYISHLVQFIQSKMINYFFSTKGHVPYYTEQTVNIFNDFIILDVKMRHNNYILLLTLVNKS